MTIRNLTNVLFFIIFILQSSCGFNLYNPNFTINNISLRNIESKPNSYLSNSITSEFKKNNILFSSNSEYLLSITKEIFHYDIISTNSNSYVRELKISLSAKYVLLNTNNEILLAKELSKSKIITLDDVNINAYSNRLEPYKTRLSDHLAKQIIYQLSKYSSTKNESLL